MSSKSLINFSTSSFESQLVKQNVKRQVDHHRTWLHVSLKQKVCCIFVSQAFDVTKWFESSPEKKMLKGKVVNWIGFSLRMNFYYGSKSQQKFQMLNEKKVKSLKKDFPWGHRTQPAGQQQSYGNCITLSTLHFTLYTQRKILNGIEVFDALKIQTEKECFGCNRVDSWFQRPRNIWGIVRRLCHNYFLFLEI